jgi:hypothetical protein
MDEAVEVLRLIEEMRAYPQVCCVSLESPSKIGCNSYPRKPQPQWICFVTTFYPDGTVDTEDCWEDSALLAVQAAHRYVTKW